MEGAGSSNWGNWLNKAWGVGHSDPNWAQNKTSQSAVVKEKFDKLLNLVGAADQSDATKKFCEIVLKIQYDVNYKILGKEKNARDKELQLELARIFGVHISPDSKQNIKDLITAVKELAFHDETVFGYKVNWGGDPNQTTSIETLLKLLKGESASANTERHFGDSYKVLIQDYIKDNNVASTADEGAINDMLKFRDQVIVEFGKVAGNADTLKQLAAQFNQEVNDEYNKAYKDSSSSWGAGALVPRVTKLRDFKLTLIELELAIQMRRLDGHNSYQRPNMEIMLNDYRSIEWQRLETVVKAEAAKIDASKGTIREKGYMSDVRSPNKDLVEQINKTIHDRHSHRDFVTQLTSDPESAKVCSNLLFNTDVGVWFEVADKKGLTISTIVTQDSSSTAGQKSNTSAADEGCNVM